MNVSPQTLLEALEGKLPKGDVSRLIEELRALPSAVVLEVAEQAEIGLTGDGNIYGNNNTIHVSKSEGVAELVQILRNAYNQEPLRGPKTSVRRELAKAEKYDQPQR